MIKPDGVDSRLIDGMSKNLTFGKISELLSVAQDCGFSGFSCLFSYPAYS